jgi:hypothetical protein
MGCKLIASPGSSSRTTRSSSPNCATSPVGIIRALLDLWERELPRISGKSKFAEAIPYARSHRAALRCSSTTVASSSARTLSSVRFAPKPLPGKLARRRIRRWRMDMGSHRHHVANPQDELHRFLRLGQVDVGAHRQSLANGNIEALVAWTSSPSSERPLLRAYVRSTRIFVRW